MYTAMVTNSFNTVTNCSNTYWKSRSVLEYTISMYIVVFL